MPSATTNTGSLKPINSCQLIIPGATTITFNNLPDISDSKQAEYNDEPIMGRTTPLKTYSHSSNRSISLTIHFITTAAGDQNTNLTSLRAIQSCVYPRDGDGSVSFYPPPICQISCGKLLGDNPLCVVLRSYSVKFPIDVAWDDTSLLPYKFDVDTQWDVVYKSSTLPGQSKILQSGS